MTKDRITDADLLVLIKKFVTDNPGINVTDCDDEVAKLIGIDSPYPSED
jgi:hypothetical protein